MEVRHVGPLELEWGFTAIKKVPGTNDTYIATKACLYSQCVYMCVRGSVGDVLMQHRCVK